MLPMWVVGRGASREWLKFFTFVSPVVFVMFLGWRVKRLIY